MALLTIDAVSKRFGQLRVLRGLSFEVEEGSVFGFIGRNGSGKTTTMKMIVGLLKADEGSIYIKGKRVEFGQTETNHLIGYLPDVPEFYGFMNAFEYLEFCGRVSGMEASALRQKIAQLLALVGLQEGAKRRIKGYSRGMKQRLGIAQALIHDPALLICDEPTSALDPQGRSELLAILHQVRDRTTVLFSTHILADVERICDTVGVLNNGCIALGGKLENLKGAHRRDTIVVAIDEREPAACASLEAQLRAQPFVQSVTADGASFSIDVGSVHEGGQQLFSYLAALQLTVMSYQVLEPTLENLYLDVVA